MTKKLGKTPTSWLAIFDWRFEYYLTPWIIRFLWVAFLLLTAGLILLNILGLVWGLLPDMSSASSLATFWRRRRGLRGTILPSKLAHGKVC